MILRSFRLHGEYYTERYSKAFLWNEWIILMTIQIRKGIKGQVLYTSGRDDQICTSAKLLDITYKSYGFLADLIEAITILMNINAVRLVSVGI